MKHPALLLICLTLLLTSMCFSVACAGGGEEEETSFFDNPWNVMTPAPTSTPVIPSATIPPIVSTQTPDGPVFVTMTFTGDLTIGTNYKVHTNMSGSIFGKELKRQNGKQDFFLRNVRDLLLSDDLTVVNFEGTLADSVTVPSDKRGNSFLFLAPPEFAETLLPNGIEACTMENNHVYDFGENGFQSTVNALEGADIVVARLDHLAVYEVNGIRIGMLAYQTFDGRYDMIRGRLQADIDNARTAGCDIVTVSYHWGAEKDYHPNSNQQKLAHETIDMGADLVVGHHSHRINPIEEYNGKYIVYSLGNFSFAGNNKPSDMLTFLFQIRFKYRRGEMFGTDIRIVPCRISSKTDYNDFIVTPLTDNFTINTIMTTLRDHGSHINNPLASYPLEWP